MNERPPGVLLLGDLDADDFQSICETVRSWRPAVDSRAAANMAEFRQVVGGDRWFPDLIVVLQSWPDQFSEAEVHELIAQCPLARIVCCYGPWCDSDGRTRSIWPLAVRVPVAAATRRLERELALLSGRDGHCRALPLTASRAEIFESDFGECEVKVSTVQIVAVISPDRRWKEMIEAGLRSLGFQNHEPGNSAPPTMVVFDADPWDAERAISLRAVRAADRDARLIAAVGFLRVDLAVALRESGADQIWFKLAPLGDLFVVPPAGGTGRVPPSGMPSDRA